MPILMLDVAVGSTLERELYATLAARTPAMLATVPEGDTVTLTMLTAALGVTPPPAPRAGSAAESIARLQDYLFSRETPPQRPLDHTVEVVSAPGEMQECVEIARRILAEADRGIPFDRIAVALHAPGRYVPYLEEALARAAIPACFARGASRPEPGGRALLALLACAAEHLSARRYAEYLSLAQVPDPDRDGPARFVAPDTIITVVEQDPADANYKVLQDNLSRLRSMRDASGRPFRIETLPMPPALFYEGTRLPASYANFYIVNGGVIMPTFGCEADSIARAILERVFPGRRVVGIPSTDLVWGLGAIHCLTQQHPAE